MGFVGSLLGMQSGNTGGAGLNYQAGSAPLLNPTTTQQATNAYGQAQSGLSQQQSFINAVNAQNGLANQQALVGQLQTAANGGGPNPALAQLAQSTGQNVNNQAALMAGQRGAGANAGLIARQAAMQGANTQQQAAGQAATMAAQQQIAARQQLQGLVGQQVGQQAGAIQGYNQAAQSEQQNLLGSIGAQNNANVANQASQNSANAGIAQQAAASQAGGLGGLLNGAGVGLGGLLGSGGGAAAGTISGAGSIAGGGGAMTGGATSGASTLNPSAFATGGMIKYTDGGAVNGPQSNVGQFLYASAPSNADSSPVPQAPASTSAPASSGGGLASLAPLAIAALAKGGQVNGEQLAAQGKMVPGKAKVKGNSYANDTVDAKLSPGEIVIPRSITQSADPVGGAAKFVQAVMAKHNMKRPK